YGSGGDQAASVFRLGHDKTAIGADFHNGEAHVFVAWHLFPVGEVAAGTLGATFDNVAGQAALGQFVIVVPAPAELMNQRSQHHGTVHHPASEDDVGARLQCRHDARSTQIGV